MRITDQLDMIDREIESELRPQAVETHTHYHTHNYYTTNNYYGNSGYPNNSLLSGAFVWFTLGFVFMSMLGIVLVIR